MKKLINKLSAFFLFAPKLKRVRNKKSGVEIEWKKILGAEGYYVYRKRGKDGEWERIADVKNTRYIDSDARSGKGYRYSVTAYNGTKESKHKNEDGRFIRFLSAPKAISVEYDPKKGVIVKWNKVKGAEGYYVYRKTKKGEWKKLANIDQDKAKGKNKNRFSFVDRTVKRNKNYRYSVRAYNGKAKSTRTSKGLKIKTRNV